ncbi:MAG: nucleotide sugar dehydrogenase [Chloroflexi bacterium]|nr:nucleotide sugar dehydrogenase [Chloroflexota bacterium]MBI5082094.1 nucleotide sugar dehydrogenase [Chloroflexota bacterium]
MPETKQTICVIGTGYVGLPAALLLARAGHTVIGVDINENIVRAINDGVLHIKEDELQKIMDEPQVRANLRAQTTPAAADVFLIAVPTPVDHRKKVAEMKYVRDATESIVPYLKAGNVVILESTVPPLTCKEFMTPILEKSGLKVGKDLYLAHCPERILPGDVFYEIVHNDRIIGAADQKSRDLASAVYATFVKGNLYQTDDVTAELCKLMENTYRDVNIALANEFAAVAEGLGIDPFQAIELSNKHPRVKILRPGIGVGGHCIPLDPWFIKEVDPANSRLIFTSRLINDEMPHKVAAKIRKAVRDIDNPKLVLIGAAYKANTEDPRESPAIEIVKILREDGYEIDHFDPLVEGYRWKSTLAEACKGADMLAVLIQHNAVMDELNATRAEIEKGMRTPRVLVFG